MGVINLKPRELELLRRIEAAPRTAHMLTHAANGVADVQMAPHVIRAYLDRLADAKLILLHDDWYHITQTGLEFLADLPQITPSTLICNASMPPGSLKLKAGYQRDTGPRYPSRGMGT
jgi:hypothetical protein